MIELNDYNYSITTFLISSLEKFNPENNQRITLGIYCCPWSGWITTNFNLTKTLEGDELNCPDFEFVEFDLLEINEWQNEYENESPRFENLGVAYDYSHEDGDEKLNEIIFLFLEKIAIEIKNTYKQEVFLQMLDSNFNKTI
jgi:hypothetical protein